MAQEKTNFMTGRQRLRNAFSAADLCEILIKYVNRCRHQYFQKTTANFSLKGSFTLKNRLFEQCFSGCLVISLQTN